MKLFFRLLNVATLIVAMAACSTTQIRFQVDAPPKVSIYEYKKIVIPTFKGSHGQLITDQLINRFSQIGYYDVISKDTLDKILTKHKISQADLNDINKTSSIAELNNAVLIVGGIKNESYQQAEGMRKEKCLKFKKLKPKLVDCYFNFIKGTWSADIKIDITSLAKGNLLIARSYSKTRSKEKKIEVDANGTNIKKNSTSKKNQLAILEVASAVVSGGSLADGVKKAVGVIIEDDNKPKADWSEGDYDNVIDVALNNFMTLLQPNKEGITLVLFEDDSLPQLEVGVKYAENKDWGMAIREFKEAVEKAESSPKISKEWKAKSYYNLGVVYGLTGKNYKKSINMINRAIKVLPEEEFYNGLKRIKKIEQYDKTMQRFRSRIGEENVYLENISVSIIAS